MTPLSNHLLVEPVIYKYSGSIVLPPSAQDANNTGGTKLWRVKGVGPGRITKKGVRVPMDISPTDYVLTHSFTEGAVQLKDGLSVISETMVLAVIPAPEHEKQQANV